MVPRWNGLGKRARVGAAVRGVVYLKMLWGYPPEGLQAPPCSVLSRAPRLLTLAKLLGGGVCPQGLVLSQEPRFSCPERVGLSPCPGQGDSGVAVYLCAFG